MNWQDFKNSFGSNNYYSLDFCDFKIVIDLAYAFKHFKKNTNNENREIINSVIKPILDDPLIVIKDTYNNEKSLRDHCIIKFFSYSRACKTNCVNLKK